MVHHLVDAAVGINPLFAVQGLAGGLQLHVGLGVAVGRPRAAFVQQGKQHAIGIEAGAGPAAKTQGWHHVRSALGTFEVTGHVRHVDLDVQACIHQHLLNGLHDALVKHRRCGHFDFNFGSRPGFFHQRLGLFEVKRNGGEVGRPPSVGLRQHLPDGLVKTAQNTVYQRSLVDGHGHSLPDFFIVERGLGGVQAHIGNPLGRLGQHLGLGRIFQRCRQV